MRRIVLLGLSAFSLWERAEGFHQSTPRLTVVSRLPIAHYLNSNDPESEHRSVTKSSTELSALLDPAILSQENIVNAFSVATFLPQPFWVLLTVLPKNSITKRIMGGMGETHESVCM